MTIAIANVKNLPPVAEWRPWMVYVGRRDNRKGLQASPLANPFVIGDTFGARSNLRKLTQGDCVKEYRRWLGAWLERQGMLLRKRGAPPSLSEKIIAELARLRALHEKHGTLVLVCWCEDWDGAGDAPGLCHAEVIKEALEAGE